MSDMFRRAAMRVQDALHEAYIQRTKRRCLAAIDAGDRLMARIYWQLMIAAVNARSVEQVERMERRRGVRR
jgi:hypothetical protein